MHNRDDPESCVAFQAECPPQGSSKSVLEALTLANNLHKEDWGHTWQTAREKFSQTWWERKIRGVNDEGQHAETAYQVANVAKALGCGGDRGAWIRKLERGRSLAKTMCTFGELG